MYGHRKVIVLTYAQLVIDKFYNKYFAVYGLTYLYFILTCYINFSNLIAINLIYSQEYEYYYKNIIKLSIFKVTTFFNAMTNKTMIFRFAIIC